MNNMSTTSPRNKTSVYLFAAACLAAGLAIGAWHPWTGEQRPSSADSPCEYEHINPLRCGEDLPQQAEYSVFKQELLTQLEKTKAEKKISEAALYFRDLNNGPTFYFNEQTQFAPMSLLKLPMMVAVYKYAETNPNVFKEKLRTPAAFGENSQVMEAGTTLEPGKEYTIEELARYMVAYSDNRSIDMLSAWLEKKGSNFELVRRTMSDLGIVGYESDLSNTTITVKQYASIFRILYNASYLDAALSEQALDVLSQTTFKEGLTRDLPAGTVVAHKFGVRAYVAGEQQLHDCGIVYHPKSPYLICIMTRGSDYENLSEYIAETSKKIYTEVDRRSR